MSFALHLGKLFAFLFVFYLLELGLSYGLFPDSACYAPFPGNQCILDTKYADQTLFGTEPRLAFFDRNRLMGKGKKIIIVGASSTLQGFRPNQLSPYFPGWEIHNISVSSSPIKQLDDLVDLIFDAIPQENRKELVIVFGIYYGSFVEKEGWKSGLSDIDVEKIRYGLYRENGSQKPIPLLSKEHMKFAVTAIRPFLLASSFFVRLMPFTDSIKRKARGLFGVKVPGKITDPDTHIVTQEERERSLKSIEQFMGPPENWGEDHFNLLQEIAKKITSTGAKMVLIDMPIPPWHREMSPYDKIYQSRLAPHLRQLTSLSGFYYGNMRANFNDDDFFDYAHPRPKVTLQWAQQLAPLILPSLADVSSSER